jgi:hypothetical protein
MTQKRPITASARYAPISGVRYTVAFSTQHTVNHVNTWQLPLLHTKDNVLMYR